MEMLAVIVAIILLVIPIGAVPCYPNPIRQSVDLSSNGMMLCQQMCTNWCWASTLQAVIQYIDPRRGTFSCGANECILASNLYTIRTGFSTNCCAFGCYGACNQGALFPEITRILLGIGISSTTYNRPLTEYELKMELSQNRPIMMRVKGGETDHALLIYGFNEPDIFYVSDPWPTSLGGIGLYRAFPYNSLMTYKGTAVWYQSFAQIVTGTCQQTVLSTPSPIPFIPQTTTRASTPVITTPSPTTTVVPSGLIFRSYEQSTNFYIYFDCSTFSRTSELVVSINAIAMSTSSSAYVFGQIIYESLGICDPNIILFNVSRSVNNSLRFVSNYGNAIRTTLIGPLYITSSIYMGDYRLDVRASFRAATSNISLTLAPPTINPIINTMAPITSGAFRFNIAIIFISFILLLLFS